MPNVEGATMQVKRSNLILLFFLLLAIFPPAIIVSVDWLYYQFTGIHYVDITKGMIAYFLYLPAFTVIILLIILYRIFINKLALKENVMYLFSFVLLLFFTVFRLAGFG
jgi:hypothetical protein